MSTILFGGTVSLINSATPSSGYIVGYDIDGILKQKDQFGVITEIGGGPTAGNTGTASLLQVLQVGNTTGTNSIIMGNGTSILSSNGNSQISLDYTNSQNDIFISNFSGASSSNIRVRPSIIEIGNLIGTTFSNTQFSLNSLVSNVGTNTVFTTINTQQNVFDVTFNRTSLLDGTISLIKGGSTYDSGSLNKAFVHINTINSTTNNGIQNSVIIGGDGLIANESNTVYVPQLVIKNGDVIKGSVGNSSIKFTENNDGLIINDSNNSVIGLISSTTSYNSYNGILLVDSSTGSFSPNVTSGVSLVSTQNSYISNGISNTVLIGGVGLSASQSDTVYLGNFVNINNAYTLPNIDGVSGQVLKTDGLGNVSWQTDSTTASVGPLSQVLSAGNNSETNDIIMGTSTSIKSARGGGQIDLDFSTNEVIISTDNANFITSYLELNNTDITIDSSNGGLNILTGDSTIVTGNGQGLKYGFDYSSGFVTYSLVNKGYVDAGTTSIWNEINNNLISDVTAGKGLSGGGSFGGVTLDVNLEVNSGLTFSSDNITIQLNSDSLEVGSNNQIRLKNVITGDRQFSDSVTISGNLTIAGTATFVNTEELFVADNIITLLATYSSGTPFLNGGIDVSRGSSQSASILWNESIDYWQVGLSGSESTIITEAGSGLVKSNNELSVDFGTVSSVSYVDAGTTSLWVAIDSINDNYITEVIAGQGLTSSGTASVVTLDVQVDNGLSIKNDIIVLGGTLSQNTTINGSDLDLIIGNVATILMTASTFVVEADGFISLDAGTGSIQVLADDNITLLSNSIDLSSISDINLTFTSSTITDSGSGYGLVYTSDYSGTFVTNSLISKQYVDGVVASASNFANTNLTFTGNREHNTNGNSFQITSDNGGFTEFYIQGDPVSPTPFLLFGYGAQYIYQTDNSTEIYSNNSNRIKMITSETVINENGFNIDFRVEGDTDQNLLFVDASTDRIGVGTASPSYKLHVIGTVSTTGFRMTNGASSGYLLQSDGSGNATWTSVNSLNIPIKYTQFGLSLTAHTPSTITHNLGTQSIICQAWDTSTGETVNVTFKNRLTNSVDILSTANVTVDVIIQG